MMFCSSTFEPDGFNCRTRRIVYYLLPKLHYKQLYIYIDTLSYVYIENIIIVILLNILEYILIYIINIPSYNKSCM